MDALTLFVLIAVIIVVGAFIQLDSQKKKRAKLEDVIGAQEGFEATHQYAGEDCKTAIAVDDAARKVCFVNAPDQAVLYSYEDLLSCEVFEDGESVTKTVRSSQALGVVVGGLAFGGVGAVVGGLSGAKKSAGKVRRIELRVVVNDMKSPIHDVCFLSTEASKVGVVYSVASEQARFWAGLLAVAIKQGNGRAAKAPDATRPRPSVSDEIRSLAKLRDEGLLTDEEFVSQKAKLLS